MPILMPTPEDKKDILDHFSDPSRKAALIGSKVVLPKILDDDGKVRDTWASPNACFQLNMKQARFLKAYEEELNIDLACEKADVTMEWAKHFLKSRNAEGYLEEKQKLKELSNVATPNWTKAKMVEGITDIWQPKNEKVALKCLEMVKDINFPRAAPTLNINNNILNLPKMSAESEAALKLIADKEADQLDEAANA